MTQAANLAALGTNAGTTGILPAAGGGTAGTGGVTGFKNRLINGQMLIWQRGTSSTSTGYQTVDRWSFYADSSRSISRSTDAPNGYSYSASVSGTGSTGLTQKIESYNVADLYGQSITVSFWLKQSTGAGSNAIALNLYYPTAQDNYNSTVQIGSTQNFTTTTGWAQYSATFTNLPAGVVNGIQLTIVTTSGSAVAFLLTGVQLEVGTAATNFDVRSYGTELGLCQRYYWRNSVTEAYGWLGLGTCLSATNARIGIAIGQTMRTAPTVSSGGATRVFDGGTAVSASSFVMNNNSLVYPQLDVTTNSGLTQGRAAFFGANNNGNTYLAFDAEL